MSCVKVVVYYEQLFSLRNQSDLKSKTNIKIYHLFFWFQLSIFFIQQQEKNTYYIWLGNCIVLVSRKST